MTSAPPNASSTPSGKSIHISSSHTYSSLQQQQITSPGAESSSRRSSGIPSANSNHTFASPRHNQSKKKPHKNSQRPQLTGEDTMAESGALRNANSRRGQQSITHLMNFTLPPRPQDYRNTLPRGGTRRGNIYGVGSGHHSSDKARYIHANYRFIVKPTGEYKPQAINADQPLDWHDVLQILASSVSQDASCPICLSHPVAPRMAKCGHIFCLPCLIRYMHSSDDSASMPEKKARWKKCPICWDSVYISETKPVRWYTGQEGPAPREGDDVVLRLVMRQPGSTLALPRDGADVLSRAEDVPWYLAAEVTDYARIMKGGEDYMSQQFDGEIEELRRQETEDELMFGEEPEWTRKAVRAVYEAKERVQGLGNPPIPVKPSEKAPKKAIQFKAVDEHAPEVYYLQSVPRSGMYNPTVPVSDLRSEEFIKDDSAKKNPQNGQDQHAKLLPKTRTSFSDGHHPDAPYYFYQSLLHYYLAPLDIRVLKSAFGNFALFPSTLLPRVERVSTGHIMDDDLRKRTKYLSHLPYGCEVGFLECNWTDVVAPEILDQFKEEIEKRRKRNRDKEYREEKDKQRAEREEDDARWANVRRKRPTIQEDDSLSRTEFAPVALSLDENNSSPPWPSRQGSAFASLASPSTSPPSGPKTVWGTALIAPASPETLAQHPEPEGDDGWLQSWEAELRAENDLIAQVQAVSLNGEGSSAGNIKPAGGGKKKKAKKITLMSTTARRAA